MQHNPKGEPLKKTLRLIESAEQHIKIQAQAIESQNWELLEAEIKQLEPILLGLRKTITLTRNSSQNIFEERIDILQALTKKFLIKLSDIQTASKSKVQKIDQALANLKLTSKTYGQN